LKKAIRDWKKKKRAVRKRENCRKVGDTVLRWVTKTSRAKKKKKKKKLIGLVHVSFRHRHLRKKPDSWSCGKIGKKIK